MAISILIIKDNQPYHFISVLNNKQWVFYDEIPAEGECLYEIVWKTKHTLDTAIHYFSDPAIDVNYFLITGPESAEAIETLNTLLKKYLYTEDEILQLWKAASSEQEKIQAIRYAGITVQGNTNLVLSEVITEAKYNSSEQLQEAQAAIADYKNGLMRKGEEVAPEVSKEIKDIASGLPAWVDELRQNEKVTQLGIEIFNTKIIDIKNQSAKDFILIGEGPALPAQTISPQYWISKMRPDLLWIEWANEMKENPELLFPINPDAFSLEAFSRIYFVPAKTLAPMFPLAASLSNMKEIREQPDPVVTSSLFETPYKTLHYFIRAITEDDIVSQENKTVFNPYIYSLPITMASASGGKHSQYWTSFSKSLFGFVFDDYYSNPHYLCALHISYLPQQHQHWIKEMKEKLNDPLVNLLPDDVPIDVLKAVTAFQFDSLTGIDELSKQVLENDINAIIELTATITDEDFDKVFSRFVNAENDQIINVMAEEAYRRRNLPLLQIMVAHPAVEVSIKEYIQRYLKSESNKN